MVHISTFFFRPPLTHSLALLTIPHYILRGILQNPFLITKGALTRVFQSVILTNDLVAIPRWCYENLVDFNATKTQSFIIIKKETETFPGIVLFSPDDLLFARPKNVPPSSIAHMYEVLLQNLQSIC